VRPGDRISFNQAGLLPYVQDVENVDDLGICSDFVAKLPTTDVYYTTVGRYSPVTNAPVIRTAHAYLLYRDVRFLIAPLDLILKANGDRVPETVLDGAFELVEAGPLASNVIYRRTSKSMDSFTRDPDTFTENVAHASRLVRASIDGASLTPDDAASRMPFLRELRLTSPFSLARVYEIVFARHDEHLAAVYARGVGSSVPATLTMALYDEANREVYRREMAVGPQSVPLFEPLPSGTRASRLSVAVRAQGDGVLTLEDLRVQGQSKALRKYVQRRLRFSMPGWYN
jgi:hypothetical protein